jgi:glycosyltransferase involved in cell wall biosynthesis
MPRISIVTATYNRSEVLRWAIASVRSQTFEDWEHVVVGDACTDDTADVVASFADSRIRFVNQSVNFGEQSGPNNEGLRHASGDLIAYLNHDDLWFPDHLAELVQFLDESGSDLVYSPTVSIDRHGQVFCGVTNAELRYDPSHFVPASLWVARRALLDELGGWRPATETDARTPSQDVLYRAWDLRKVLRCHPRITALLLPSGGRPHSYVLRDDSQHRAYWADMQQPAFRERLATSMVMSLSRELRDDRETSVGWVNRLVDRMLVLLRLHPDAVRNRLAGRQRGWWIDHLRELRGLPSLADRNAP